MNTLYSSHSFRVHVIHLKEIFRTNKYEIFSLQIAFIDLFKDIKFSKVTETSLTLLHEKEEVSLDKSVQLQPMEIYSYKVHWS